MMKQYQGVSIQSDTITLPYTYQKEYKTSTTNDLEPFLFSLFKPSIMNQPHWLTHTLDNTVDAIVITTSYLDYPGPEIVMHVGS